MIPYIINSILCSVLLITAYFLFLEKETFHRFKRWYLLGTLLLSVTIPLITIELEQPQLTAHIGKMEEYLAIETPLLAEQPVTASSETVSPAFQFDWTIVILVVYGIVTTLLLFRMFNNFLSILSDVHDKTITTYRESTLVMHNKHVVPYSFLNYIFISRQDFNNKQIMLHELTHVRQRHTLDILLLEFIHCLMWFNPAIILYKRAIRLNHEFLADEVVIKNHPTVDYQTILFQKAKFLTAASLASSFNYSATKKRFIMMTKSKNKTLGTIKVIVSWIVICGAAVLFSEKAYAQNDQPLVVVTQDSTTSMANSISEFDTLIQKYVRYRKNKAGQEYISFNTTGITKEEKARMKQLYDVMTKEQKAKYPEHVSMVFTPPTPPQKKSPTAQELAELADAKVYGVWLDGKRVPNTELAKLKPSDIAIVWKSRLMKNAAQYGQYKFHADVMTHAYFDKTYPAKSN